MRKDNIFVVGGQVAGPSFFGRSEELGTLSRERQSNSRGRAIIGLNRIGKSSLINKLMLQECVGRDDLLYLKLAVYDSSSQGDFWKSFTNALAAEIQRLNIQDSDIHTHLAQISDKHVEQTADTKPGFFAWLRRTFLSHQTQPSTPAAAAATAENHDDHQVTEFNTQIGSQLKKILERLGELNYWVVIVLDEFDAARQLFKERPGSLSLIRNMATEASMSHVAVYTISRRSLDIIEQGIAEALESSTSTLSGAFSAYRIKGFSSVDMLDYWDALSEYDFFPSDEIKQRIVYYAGYHPLLLSLFGNRIADRIMAGKEITVESIDKIASIEWLDFISKQYDTTLTCMREDGFARDLRAILCGPIDNITRETVESFIDNGYLDSDADGFFTISRHFNKYFIRETADITSTLWETIMESERTLKSFMILEYPQLETLRYTDIDGHPGWAANLTAAYPNLHLNENIVGANMKRTQDTYDSNPTVIDSLMLSYIVRHILDNWSVFRKYFNNEAPTNWQRDMELVAKARNALAHACPEYLRQYETDMLPACCNKINALNQNRV